MKITIIGGGNIGTLMAAEAACRGNRVIIYTSKPEKWNTEISVYNKEDELLLRGSLFKVTYSMQEALNEAEHIWITMPPHLFLSLSEKMLPFVQEGQKIGIIPGSGGAEFAFHDIVKKGCILFGLQRVHSIARLKKYGEAVYELGRKRRLQIGSIPSFCSTEICKEIEGIFNMPCEPLKNYLSVTLTPSNPILHTTRLYSMFKNYKKDDVYPKNILFYEEWTNDSSEILLACDRELQDICCAIPLELNEVISLRDYYESQTVDAMTKKIKEIKAFKGLLSPMKQTKNGWIPDWNSRYFVSDFAFGLKVIKDIGGIFSRHTPNIDKVWKWYEKTAVNPKVDVFSTDLYMSDFLELYE